MPECVESSWDSVPKNKNSNDTSQCAQSSAVRKSMRKRKQNRQSLTFKEGY